MSRDPRLQGVQNAVGALVEPLLKWTLNDLQLVRSAEIAENILKLHIELITDKDEQVYRFKRELLNVVAPFEFAAVELKLTAVESGGKGIDGVKNIFLVGSGKGGGEKFSCCEPCCNASAARVSCRSY